MNQIPVFKAWLGKQVFRFAPVIFFSGILMLWELVCQVGEVPNYILPAPSAITKAFFNVEFSRWMFHLWATLHVALLGFGLSILIAIPLSIAMVRSKLLSRTIYPALIVIQSTPIVAVAPLIIVLLGTDDPSRVLITCLITFFPIIVSTTTGMMETPPEMIELANHYGHLDTVKLGRSVFLMRSHIYSVVCVYQLHYRLSVLWLRSLSPQSRGLVILSNFRPLFLKSLKLLLV